MFWLNVITYYGYVVPSKRMMVDPQKVAKVKLWPRPQLHSIFGAFWVYPVIIEGLWKTFLLLLHHSPS